MSEEKWEWTCPNCQEKQIEIITEDGPVIDALCGNCFTCIPIEEMERIGKKL